MRTDKQEAFRYRLQGLSYTEIHKILGVPKSTLSGWFGSLVLSEDIQKKLSQRTQEKSFQGLLARNKKQTFLARKRATSHRSAAAKEVMRLSDRELMLVAASLYWAEGYKRLKIKDGKEKTAHPVSLTNSDPKLIGIFIRFLSEYCSVKREDMHLSIRLFEHQNHVVEKRYWSGVLGLLPKNVTTINAPVPSGRVGKRPYNQLLHGVAQLRVYRTDLFYRIMGYVEGIQKVV